MARNAPPTIARAVAIKCPAMAPLATPKGDYRKKKDTWSMLKPAKPNNSQVNTVKQLSNTPVQHPKQLLPA